MTFGERLSLCIERAGLKQKQLAEMIEVTPTRLNYWIKDKREPDIAYIKKLAEVLNVSTDYLIGNVSDAVSPNAASGYSDLQDSPALISEQALHIAALYDTTTDQGRELFDSIAVFIEKTF